MISCGTDAQVKRVDGGGIISHGVSAEPHATPSGSVVRCKQAAVAGNITAGQAQGPNQELENQTDEDFADQQAQTYPLTNTHMYLQLEEVCVCVCVCVCRS